MKILIFSSKYPPQVGGVEEVVKNLSIELSKQSEVIVITSLNLRLAAKDYINKLRQGFSVKNSTKNEKITVYEFFISLPRSILGFISFPYRFTASIFLLRKTIKKFNPDVINAHFLDDSLFYFYFATLFMRKKIVTDVHGNELHVFSKNTLYKYFFNKVLNKSKSVVVHSKYMKSYLLSLYPGTQNILIIENSVDIKKLKPILHPTKDYYLFVGRLDYKKGIDVLIKAYKKIDSKVSRKLLIIGGASGEKKHGSLNIDDLKKQTIGLKIEFLGKIPNSEVLSKYFPNAYFSIFPSRYEPFGIVALESLGCGTPFIASSGGFKEIAKNTGGGVIFKEGAVSSLANIILKLDKDIRYRDRLSSMGYTNIKKYDMKIFIKKYSNCLKNI